MEPTEAYAKWHRWTVHGPNERISQMINHLDLNLPNQWRRLNASDLVRFQPRAIDGAACYTCILPGSDLSITLCLQRGESQLRGGKFWFGNAPKPIPAPLIEATWDEVMRFLETGVLPAAKAVGIDMILPTTEEMFFSDLPFDVRERLRSFSTGASKSLPLGDKEDDLWRQFVVTVFRARTGIDGPVFTNWLQSDGWTKEAAVELTTRLFDQCLLLSHYKDEMWAS